MNYLITNLGSGLVDDSVKGKISENYKQKATELTNFYIKPNKNIAKRPPLRQVTEFGNLTNVVDTAATSTRQIFLRKWDNSNVADLEEWNNILREVTNVRTGYETNSDLFQAVDPYEEGFEYQIFAKKQGPVTFDVNPNVVDYYLKGTDNTIYIKTHATSPDAQNLRTFTRGSTAETNEFNSFAVSGGNRALAIFTFTVEQYLTYSGDGYTDLNTNMNKTQMQVYNALGPHDACLMLLTSGVYFGVNETAAARDTGRYGTISFRFGNFSVNLNTRSPGSRLLTDAQARNIEGLGTMAGIADDVRTTTWYRVTSSNLQPSEGASVDISIHSDHVFLGWISNDYEHTTPIAPVVGRSFDQSDSNNPVSLASYNFSDIFTSEPFQNQSTRDTIRRNSYIASTFDVTGFKYGATGNWIADPDRGARARLYVRDTHRALGQDDIRVVILLHEQTPNEMRFDILATGQGRNLNDVNLIFSDDRGRVLQQVRLEDQTDETVTNEYLIATRTRRQGINTAIMATTTLSVTDTINFRNMIRDNPDIKVNITGVHDIADNDIQFSAIGEEFNAGTPEANEYIYSEETGVVTVGANLYDTEWSTSKPEITGPGQKVWKMGISTIDAVNSRPEEDTPHFFDIKSDIPPGGAHYGEFSEYGIVDANDFTLPPPELADQLITTQGRNNPIRLKLNNLYTTLDTNLDQNDNFTPPSANSTDRVWLTSPGIYSVPGANENARRLVTNAGFSRIDTHVNQTNIIITKDGQEYQGAIKFDRAALEVTLYLTSRVNLGRIWIDQGNHSIYFDTRQEPHATGRLGPNVQLNGRTTTVVYQGLRGDRPGVFNIDSSFFPEMNDKIYYLRIEDPSVELDFQHVEYNVGTPRGNSYVFDEETGEITFGLPENERQWTATNLPRIRYETDVIWTMNIATVKNKNQENGKYYPVFSTIPNSELTEGSFAVSGLREADYEDAEVHELFEKIGESYFNPAGLLQIAPIQRLPDFAVIDVYNKANNQRIAKESFLFVSWTPEAVWYPGRPSNFRLYAKTFRQTGVNDRTVYPLRDTYIDYLSTNPSESNVSLEDDVDREAAISAWEEYSTTAAGLSPTYLWIVGQGVDVTDSNQSFDHFLYRGLITNWTPGPDYEPGSNPGYNFRRIGETLFGDIGIGLPADGLNNAHLQERHYGSNGALPDKLEARSQGVGFRAFGLSYTWDTVLSCDNSGVAAWRSADTREESMNTFPEKTINIDVDKLPVQIAEFEPYQTIEPDQTEARGHSNGAVVRFSPTFFDFREYIETNTDYAPIKALLQFALTDTGLEKDSEIYDKENAVVSILPDIKITAPGSDMNAVGKYLYSLPDGSHLFVADHNYLNLPKPRLKKDKPTDVKATINDTSHLPYQAGLRNLDADGENMGYEADTGSAMGSVGVTLYRQVGNKRDPNSNEPIFYPFPTTFPSALNDNSEGSRNPNRADTIKVIYLTLDYSDGTNRISDIMRELRLISWYSSRGTQGFHALGMVQIDQPPVNPLTTNFDAIDYMAHLQEDCFKMFSKREPIGSPTRYRIHLNWIPWFSQNVSKYTYKYATYKQPRLAEYQSPNTIEFIEKTSTSTEQGGVTTTVDSVNLDTGLNDDDAKSTYTRDLQASSLGLPGTTTNDITTGAVTKAHLSTFARTENNFSVSTAGSASIAELKTVLGQLRRIRGGGEIFGENSLVTAGRLDWHWVREGTTEHRVAEKPSAADRRAYGIPGRRGVGRVCAERDIFTFSGLTRPWDHDARCVRWEPSYYLAPVWAKNGHQFSITATLNGKTENIPLDRRAGTANNIDKIIKRYEERLAELENAAAGGLRPYSTEFIAYDYIEGERFDIYERDIIGTRSTVTFSDTNRPGIFSLGYKKFYDAIPNNRSATYTNYLGTADLGTTVPTVTALKQPSDPATYELRPEFGRDIEIRDIVETQYGALMVTNQKVYTINNLRSEPVINVTVDGGLDTSLVFDSSTYFGAIGDKVKALRYFREVDGYLSQIVNKQLELPGPVTSMAGLLNKHKLLFVHCDVKGEEVYVLSFGENRAVNGWSKFILPFPVSKIFTTDDDSLLLVTESNATYRMNFAADISKDQYKWRDQLLFPTVYQPYETALTTMPIINVNEEDFSVTDNTNITKFIAGMIGNPVFDVQIKGNDFFNRRYSQNDSEIASIEYRDADGGELEIGQNVSGQVLIENIPQNGSNQPQLRITKNDKEYIEFSSFNILLGKG